MARNPHNTQVPEPTIQRLSVYLRCLRQAKSEGLKTLSSATLQERSGIPAGQIRKDLSYFGDFGRPGIGYSVESTLERLSRIMHLDRQRNVVIVGAGNLGAALAGYQGLLVSLFVLGLSLFKGQLIGDYYMGLKWVSGVWRWLVVGWLLIPGSLISWAFFITE